VAKDAIALLERAFANGGGFEAALAEARYPAHGGLRRVLDVVTDQYKAEQRSKHVSRVVREAIDPLDWDARVAFYTIRPTDTDACEFYEGNLYTSQAAEQLPCSARAIVYCPLAASALIGLQAKRFATDQPMKKEILFDLPTLTLIVT